MNAVNTLKSWFNNLGRAEQEEVIRFLYDERILLHEGRYFGPHPRLLNKGLHCGPVPLSAVTANICPTCGRRL
jgi:hypothetical protein